LASTKPPLNPFHFLLGLMGVIFTVTAIGFTVLIVREEKQAWQQPTPVVAKGTAKEPDMREHPLLKLLSAHGMEILLYQIGVIAVFTAAAIGLDRWRDVRAERNKPKSGETANSTESEKQLTDASG
jgi:hypothetical protein